MAPKKAPVANTSPSDKALCWSMKMDDALIDAFMHELEIGNKVKKTFTATAYDNITQYLSTVFGFEVDKEKVKNRWKTLKKNFSEIYDIFNDGMNGFSWNSSTKRWEAEDHVWNKLIEVKPKAIHWRNNPMPNYEKMLALYGNDRANGDDHETPPNMKKRGRTNPQEFVEIVNEVDPHASQNEVTLENFSIDMENFPLDGHSSGANSESHKRPKKGAATKDKGPLQISQIAEKMDVIAAVLREGNQIFRERYALQISGEETVKLIRDCGCDEEKIPDIYCFLMNDVAKLRIVIQCPPLLRKRVIMKMVFGS